MHWLLSEDLLEFVCVCVCVCVWRDICKFDKTCGKGWILRGATVVTVTMCSEIVTVPYLISSLYMSGGYRLVPCLPFLSQIVNTDLYRGRCTKI